MWRLKGAQWSCRGCKEEKLEEERRCPLMGFSPNPENDEEEGAVAYLSKREVGSGDNRGHVDSDPCYQCPEGCVILVGETSDGLQLLRDFGNENPDSWTLVQTQTYLALRRAEWIK